MTARLGSTRVRVHPLLPALWCFSLVSGMGRRFTPLLLALLLHESGHLLMAAALGIPVEEVEITPMGGVMTVDDPDGLSPLRAFLLALAGPAFSLFGCLLSSVLYRHTGISFSAASAFAQGNLVLLLFNLLPALPLDGGNMLRAILRLFFPAAALTRVLSAAGFAVAAALCGVSLYFAIQGQILLAPVFAGLYLFYASAVEGRDSTARYVTSLIARRQKLEKNEVLAVEAAAASQDMPVGKLLGKLRPGKYHVVYVLSRDGMRALGMLDEQQLCDNLLERRGVTLGGALEIADRKQ